MDITGHAATMPPAFEEAMPGSRDVGLRAPEPVAWATAEIR